MNAYIVAGYRSAVGRAKKGGFRFYRPDDLAADVIKHLVSSIKDFDASRVDDLIVGNAIPEAEQGLQMGRYISLLSLPISVPGMIINRYCGSGLEAKRKDEWSCRIQSAEAARALCQCTYYDYFRISQQKRFAEMGDPSQT